jgi:hypothetical protein
LLYILPLLIIGRNLYCWITWIRSFWSNANLCEIWYFLHCYLSISYHIILRIYKSTLQSNISLRSIIISELIEFQTFKSQRGISWIWEILWIRDFNNERLNILKCIFDISIMKNSVIYKLLIVSWDWNNYFSWYSCWTWVYCQICIVYIGGINCLLSKSNSKITNICLVKTFSKNLNNCISW